MGDCLARIEALATALGALHDCLSRQTAVLEGNDIDALPELTRSQDHAVAVVGQCWSALIDGLDLPNPPSRRQIEQALPTGAGDLWARIMTLAEAVERINRLNGRLIDEQLRRTRGALHVLHGAASQRTLYGSDGHVIDLFSPNRDIDEA